MKYVQKGPYFFPPRISMRSFKDCCWAFSASTACMWLAAALLRLDWVVGRHKEQLPANVPTAQPARQRLSLVLGESLDWVSGQSWVSQPGKKSLLSIPEEWVLSCLWKPHELRVTRNGGSQEKKVLVTQWGKVGGWWRKIHFDGQWQKSLMIWKISEGLSCHFLPLLFHASQK